MYHLIKVCPPVESSHMYHLIKIVLPVEGSHMYHLIKVDSPVEGNRIGGVMVSMLASSALDRGFEHRSGQTKDFKIGMCCFSAKHAA
jgi:hypothetical protein